MTGDTPPNEMTPEYLKGALTVFKKRLKLTKLDAESSLGGGPFSGGRDSGIVAIQPPSQYPREVWDKLVEMGKLRHAGGGLYGLCNDAGAR
jgi:hypothetical protein